jgi:predicted RND superfamily exporter protein
VTDAYREVNNRDIAKLLPFMLLMVLAFLWWNFKSIEAVLIPFVVLVLSVLASFGLMGFLELKFNNLSSCIPGILLAISIADTVHILSNFYKNFQTHLDFNLALRESLVKNFAPTLFTSLSTAIGFATLLSSSIIPIRDLGVIAGFGTMVAWLLTIFMLPGLFSFIPASWILKTKVRKTSFLNINYDQSKAFVDWIFRSRFWIVSIVFILSITAIYLSSKNIVNSDPLEYFDKKVPVRKTYDFIREQLKSVGGPEIVIHAGVPDGVKNPEFLRKVEQFEEWILLNVNTAKSVHSLVHVIKDLNQKFNQNKSDYYLIPSSQELVAQYLFLYTMNLPEGLDINNRVTSDFETMRLSVMWNIPDAHRSVIEIDKINAKAKEMGLNAYVSGQMPLYHRLNAYVVQTFVSSMSLAIVLVAVFMIWILRSFKMGMFSMIPNVIPLTFGGAIMYLNKTDIDLGAAINYSVCLGVVVDDTIHFLFDYNRRRKSGFSIHESITQVFVQTGPALVLTTIILTVGFGLFYFSEFVPNINFGLYCAIIFIFALVMDIIFLPALLLLNHRKSLE